MQFNTAGEHEFLRLPQGRAQKSELATETMQARSLHASLRRRNTNARHRGVLAAERKERARVRSEQNICQGGRPLKAAA
ncbi:hypothetical protein ACWC3X_42515 [Streptomyces populi]